VNWWAVTGLLQFGRCELLLLEAGSWGTGIILEPRVNRTSAVGSRYQATTGEESGLRRLSACCIELHSMWISDSALVTIHERSINAVTNPNPVYGHSYTWQYLTGENDSVGMKKVSVLSVRAHLCMDLSWLAGREKFRKINIFICTVLLIRLLTTLTE
jgi:hypothetical protein